MGNSSGRSIDGSDLEIFLPITNAWIEAIKAELSSRDYLWITAGMLTSVATAAIGTALAIEWLVATALVVGIASVVFGVYIAVSHFLAEEDETVSDENLHIAIQAAKVIYFPELLPQLA